MDNTAPMNFFQQHEFLIRRIHSLSGLIPVGAYMCVHLLTNSLTGWGVEPFQNAVYQIHSLGPLLPLVEWGFIFLPILFSILLYLSSSSSGGGGLLSCCYDYNSLPPPFLFCAHKHSSSILHCRIGCSR